MKHHKLSRSLSLGSYTTLLVMDCLAYIAAAAIGAKPDLYSKTIELVCGGSPIGCVLVERKAQHRGKWEQQQHRGKWEQQQHRTSLD